MSFSTITMAYHKQCQDRSFTHESMVHEPPKQACDDYLEDIMKHMRQMEDVTQPVVALIDTQPDVRWFMRPYLLDILIRAHQHFQLLPETLFLTINLLDRYCSKRVVFMRHYQLIGCVSLLIASKYGDRKGRVPMIKELHAMCSPLYDEQMFIQTEWHVLDILEWSIGHPTVYSFIQVALLGNDEVAVEHMAQYICEAALYHRDFVSTKPSIMARASIALARTILGCHEAFDLDEDENWTAWALYQRLHKISQFLGQKYASPRLSSSSILFENFLAQRTYGRGTVVAPTIPCEIPQKPN